MNMREPDERVRFDNADIIFKHFGGEKDDFHTEGQRDFAIRIDEEESRYLADKGLNVKPFTSKDPDEPPMFYVKVKLRYGMCDDGTEWGPIINTYTDKVKRELHESNVGMLDRARILDADVVTHIYRRQNNGKPTATLTLDILHAVIKDRRYDDPYADKYAAYDDPTGDCPF